MKFEDGNQNEEEKFRTCAATSGSRQNFDSVDFRILHLGRECNVQFAVGDFHWDGLDVSAVGAASLDPDVEIVELMACNIEREHAITRSADAIKGFGKMKFDSVFPLGTGYENEVMP